MTALRFCLVLVVALATLVPVRAATSTNDPKHELMEKYFIAVTKPGGHTEVAALGGEIIKLYAKDSAKLNEFAWGILTSDLVRDRDIPLALRAAQAGIKASHGKDYALADTCARALFASGDVAAAIAMQKKAVRLCDEPGMLLQMKEMLQDYETAAASPTRRGTTVRLPLRTGSLASAVDDMELSDRFNDAGLELIEKGKMIPVAKLLEQADSKPCKLRLTVPGTERVPSEDLYGSALPSLLIVGSWTKDKDGEWSGTVASGFVIAESGVFVTNFHVLNVEGAVGMAAMTSDGRVFVVKSVLAASAVDDIAICQLDGARDLRPLSVAADARVGARVRIVGHPDQRFFTLSEGAITRYFVEHDNGNVATRFSTSADVAVGSSGAPVFNERGAVVGMVTSTESVYTGSEKDETAKGDLQMVIKSCIPAASILRLVQPAR